MSASDSNKYSLENDFLRIAIHPLGAELRSVFSKKLNIEMLWQAGAEWPKHAPVLFPIVGALKDNTIDHNGEGLTLSRHGFARERFFELVQQTETELWFGLSADAETLKIYPFEFTFLVKYALIADNLSITMEVINTGTETLYCSYGAHPAFRVPIFDDEFFEEYQLVFEPSEDRIKRWPLDANLISNVPVGIATPQGKLKLTHDLFAADAIVLKQPEFSSVSILHSDKGHGIRMHCQNWPFFGIWSAQNANFVCLEPWQGIADTVTSKGILAEKEGILRLSPGQTHKSTYSLEVLG
jgi:galactose mutarotase-like enzyme